jgi:hypothetical protein
MNRHPIPVTSFSSSAATAPQGCFDSLARGLIVHAARRAPPALAERLEEEWLAVLEERCGSMARLRLALGCCWATGVIAHEHAGISLRAATSPADATLPGALILHEPSLLPRRTVVFFVVLCLHVLVIDALVARLAWADNPHHDTETTVDLTYEVPCKPQPATGC